MLFVLIQLPNICYLTYNLLVNKFKLLLQIIIKVNSNVVAKVIFIPPFFLYSCAQPVGLLVKLTFATQGI